MTRKETMAGLSGVSIERETVIAWPLTAVLGVAATGSIVMMAILRIGINAPLHLPAIAQSGYHIVAGAALAVPAIAALGIGLTGDDLTELIGLVTVGVFGLLAVGISPSRVPALGAIVGGGVVAVLARLRSMESNGWSWDTGRRGLVVGGLLVGAVVSIGSTTGVLPPPSRTWGSALSMAGLTATPMLLEPAGREWVVGGIAFVAVLVAGVVAPYVMGAIVLVAGAVVGIPLLLIALGIGGGVTTIARAAARGRLFPLLGASCLLAAGVPTTTPRLIAFVLGLFFLIDTGGGTS